MTSLAGEFQTDLSRQDAVVACAEAIESLGWHVEALETNRIVSHPNGSSGPMLIELDLSPSDQGTEIRIIGSDTDENPVTQDALIAELDRARDAIQASVEDASNAIDGEGETAEAGPATAKAEKTSPPAGPPPGWYQNPEGPGERWWDGSNWTDHLQGAPRRPGELPENVEEPGSKVHAAQSSGNRASQQSRPKKGIRPGWRKMTWVLIIWSLLILVWAISGGASAGNECANQPTQLEEDACAAGAGIGVALILLIGFFGFVFLAIIWYMTRPKGRECPACGEIAKKGQTACRECGYDFAAAAPGAQSFREAPG